jgi:hypothetical protein
MLFGKPTFCTQGVILTRNGGTVNYLFTMNGGAWNTETQFVSTVGILADIQTDYDFGQGCPGCLGAAYVRPTRIREAFTYTSQTDFVYANPQFANVTSIKQWNNYGGVTAPATPDRLTIIAYSTDPALIAKFPWAQFRRRKAAVKMHTLLDLRGNIPTFIRVTDGKVYDVNILDEIMPEAGTFYVMDRGYIDFQRLFVFTLSSAFFVVRTKVERVVPAALLPSGGQEHGRTLETRL